MEYNVVVLTNLIKEIGSLGKTDLECSNCGKVTERSAKYIRKCINRANEFGLTKIFCGQDCATEDKNSSLYVESVCGNCNKELRVLKKRLDSSKSGKVFCNSSCAASYTNKGKLHSDASRSKVSESLKDLYGKSESAGILKECGFCNETFYAKSHSKLYCSKTCRNNSNKPTGSLKRRSYRRGIRRKGHLSIQVEFSYCPMCNSPFLSKAPKIKRKFCSKVCQLKAASIRQSEWLSKAENRSNLGRHKRSYPEQAFINWLDTNGIIYRFEPHFRNTEDTKSYFPDFVFDSIKVIIELDGTQHRKTVEKDTHRDQYIQRVFGYTVKRYWCNNFLKGVHYAEICDLLGVVIDKTKEV